MNFSAQSDWACCQTTVIEMKRLQLTWLIVCVALVDCAALPVGPKRTFDDWEFATATQTVSPANTVTTTTWPATSTSTPPHNDAAAPTLPPTDNTVQFIYPTSIPVAAQTEFGIQINGCDRDVPSALMTIQKMRLTWVKQQARWADIEKAKGEFDWTCLDRVIPAANAAGLKMLVSVTSSPAFARKPYAGVMHPTNGRPADFRDLALFLANLIARYPKQIHAIEVWNEPNLMREWGDVIDGGVYAQMLAAAYGVIKYLDPTIMVISAGIAPAGFTDVWDAVDDTVFLRGFLDYQGAQYADCLGAHANGPQGSGDIDRIATRYFDLAGHTHPICVTEFGYALPVNGQAPEGFAWIMSHTAERQAQVLVDGLRWSRQAGFVRLVILWNLNFNGAHTDPNAPYALVRSGWTSPAVDAIAQTLQTR
jgi:hypothetical protein